MGQLKTAKEKEIKAEKEKNELGTSLADQYKDYYRDQTQSYL
jgi:hypothetical protein